MMGFLDILAHWMNKLLLSLDICISVNSWSTRVPFTTIRDRTKPVKNAIRDRTKPVKNGKNQVCLWGKLPKIGQNDAFSWYFDTFDELTPFVVGYFCFYKVMKYQSPFYNTYRQDRIYKSAKSQAYLQVNFSKMAKI